MSDSEKNCQDIEDLDQIFIDFGANQTMEDFPRRVVAVYEFCASNKTYRLKIFRNIGGIYSSDVYIRGDEGDAWENCDIGYVIEESAAMALRKTLCFMRDRKFLDWPREASSGGRIG